jgi:hypothetical protein
MADYTLDQLRSLWEEGSKAGNFAPAEYQTRQSPEGEGGGGQTYEAYGVSPNSILLQNGNPNYSMPTLTKLSDEEGGGFRSVTDMLGGAEHVTYSPEGKVIDRKFYNNPKPSHQDFLKLAGGLAAGVGGLSALAGAGAAGAAGAGGFGITPEAIASLYGGAGGAGGAGGIASLGGAGSSLASSLGSKAASSLGGQLLSRALGSKGGAGSGASSAGSGLSPAMLSSLLGGGQSTFSPVSDKVYKPTLLQQGNLYEAGVPSLAKAQQPTPSEQGEEPEVAYMARGGLAGIAPQQYAAGGKFLDGPGDGTSDSIRANIEGQQEARLADGEFVIPADVVSHIGNGSSKAGAKKLYAMMDKIRHARTGTTKMGKTIKADKYLPA